jgi:hypothetical protein
MKIRKVAMDHIKSKTELNEQLNFGIKPEVYNRKKIGEKHVSNNFRMKYIKRLQNANQKISSLTADERKIIKKIDFEKVDCNPKPDT